MSDAINPDHYKRLPAEAIEIIEAMIEGAPDNKAAYLHGQAAKYDLRLWGKGKSLEDYLTDWQKHIWYALRLESHLLGLIEKQKADEQQKAADIQSLNDYPFGKLKEPGIKQSLNTEPDPGEGYRLLSKDPSERLFDTDEGLFACGLDGKQWLSVNYSGGEQLPSVYYRRKIEPAEQTIQPPDGWRWLEVGEVIRKGDVDKSMEPVTNWWIGEACGHNHDLLRRNRFNVGEKVVRVSEHCKVYEVQVRAGGEFVMLGGFDSPVNVNELAPYIEEST